MVWARRGTATGQCPVAYITAESLGLVEEFLVRRRLGGMPLERLSARQAEAFLVLEQELGLLQAGRAPAPSGPEL